MNMSTNHSACHCDYGVTLENLFQRNYEGLVAKLGIYKNKPPFLLSVLTKNKKRGRAIHSEMNQDASDLDLR